MVEVLATLSEMAVDWVGLLELGIDCCDVVCGGAVEGLIGGGLEGMVGPIISGLFGLMAK